MTSKLPEITITHRIELNAPKQFIPLALERVSAGFASPAADYIERCIDLNEHLMPNKEASFMVRAHSQSMLNRDININDELVVDRSITARRGHIVVAMVNNDFTVKTLIIEGEGDNKRIWLRAENPDYENIYFQDGDELVIWGVVTRIIKDAINNSSFIE